MKRMLPFLTRLPGQKCSDLSQLLGWVWLEWVQLGFDPGEPLSLLPNLPLELLKGFAEPCGFGHRCLGALDQGIVLGTHDGT